MKSRIKEQVESFLRERDLSDADFGFGFGSEQKAEISELVESINNSLGIVYNNANAIHSLLDGLMDLSDPEEEDTDWSEEDEKNEEIILQLTSCKDAIYDIVLSVETSYDDSSRLLGKLKESFYDYKFLDSDVREIEEYINEIRNELREAEGVGSELIDLINQEFPLDEYAEDDEVNELESVVTGIHDNVLDTIEDFADFESSFYVLKDMIS